MDKILTENKEEIAQLCQAHGVVRLDAFGSVLTDDFNEQSDIDFLVVFDRRGGTTNAFQQYFDFKEALSSLLNREVDLVCYPAIRNPVFKKEVEKNRQLLYAA